MSLRRSSSPVVPQGLEVSAVSTAEGRELPEKLRRYLFDLGLMDLVELDDGRSGRTWRCRLRREVAEWLVPEGDTLQLAERLQQDSRLSQPALERETVIAGLASPVLFRFPSLAEYLSSVSMRVCIVESARRTRLDFETMTAERPEQYWRYDEDRGFVLRRGESLIDGLQEATQPADPARRYSFSCWRATEHVALLAMARESAAIHPELYRRICRQSECRALKAAAFERVYLRDHGSAQERLPVRYFVPGDRTWFRNPDLQSANVTGFEGSFTFYLGAGEFANFWRDCRPFTLTTKCLTIYFWRRALTLRHGEPTIDEPLVDALVAETLRDPAATERILAEMVQWQSHPECEGGGSIETFRKIPRFVCRRTADIDLPDVPVPSRRRNRSTWSHIPSAHAQ